MAAVQTALPSPEPPSGPSTSSHSSVVQSTGQRATEGPRFNPLSRALSPVPVLPPGCRHSTTVVTPECDPVVNSTRQEPADIQQVVRNLAQIGCIR